jgi:hypothetical protein
MARKLARVYIVTTDEGRQYETYELDTPLYFIKKSMRGVVDVQGAVTVRVFDPEGDIIQETTIAADRLEMPEDA